MPKATCRCGQKLSLPVNGPERVVCPNCSARVRIRRDPAKVGPGDGFVRFNCPCGRRLKVRTDALGGAMAQAGKCPDCGRVVPVPSSLLLSGSPAPSSSSGPLKLKAHGAETPTEELNADEFAALERWAASHLAKGLMPSPSPSSARVPARAEDEEPDTETAVAPPSVPQSVKVEAGLRVCPRCGRPIHLSAVACRECGAPVPKR
jgi:hypothetical protein